MTNWRKISSSQWFPTVLHWFNASKGDFWSFLFLKCHRRALCPQRNLEQHQIWPPSKEIPPQNNHLCQILVTTKAVSSTKSRNPPQNNQLCQISLVLVPFLGKSALHLVRRLLNVLFNTELSGSITSTCQLGNLTKQRQPCLGATAVLSTCCRPWQ